MTGYYEGWLEAKRRLAGNPDDEFLSNLVTNLQGLALHEYLERFVRESYTHDYDYEATYVDVEPGAQEKFLAGLDELRQLSPTDRATQIRQEFFNPAIGQVERLRHLNWTGDHTYGDALDDVVTVLLSVWDGKGFPKLERFRCPSEYGSRARQNERVRCELQLPHESKHQARNTAGGEGFMWTDEQSVNPPVPYDEPNELCGAIKTMRPGVIYTCDKTKGHGGQHADVTHEKAWNAEPTDAQLDKIADEVADEVFGNPDPINRPLVVDLDAEELSGHPIRSADGACGALNDVHPGSAGYGCVRAKRHDGLHRDGRGMRWEK